jgi:hypothetical protein
MKDEILFVFRSGTVLGCVIVFGIHCLLFSHASVVSPLTRNILNDVSNRTTPQPTGRRRRLSKLRNEQRYSTTSSGFESVHHDGEILDDRTQSQTASLPPDSAIEHFSTSNLIPHPAPSGHGRSTRPSNPPGSAACSGSFA